MAAIKAFLFDIDGTLVDSNDAHAQAFVEAFAANDIPVTFARVRSLIGMGSDKLIPALSDIPENTDPFKNIARSKKAIFKSKFLPTLRAFPAVRELLQELRARGLRLATASSADPEELESLLEVAEVADLFEVTTSAGDADESKPDPDIVKAAVRRLGLSSGECVLVGDTPYDVEAATRSGVAVIGLTCGGWSPEDLRGAAWIFKDPQDLQQNLQTVSLGG
jgi:HAD superfamily hydrolase (TIGR01509 family)